MGSGPALSARNARSSASDSGSTLRLRAKRAPAGLK